MASVAVVGVGIASGVGVLALGSSVAGTSALEASSAKPYTGKTEAELNTYIHRTWKKFILLPHYDNEMQWDVYLLCKSLFGHYSMLFVTPGHIEGFLIHLIVNDDKETEFRLKEVNLRSYPDDHPGLKALSLGKTEAFTAKHIITKAEDRLVRMGRYHTLFNNCQDFCKELASDIQVEKSICKTWYEELIAILQGVFEAAVESARCMKRVGPRTGSSLIKPLEDLCDEYDATTNQTKKDV